MNLRAIVLPVQRVRAALGRATARAGHVNIGVRMALAFGLVLALSAGTTAYAVLQMHAIDRDLRDAMQAQNDISGQAATMRRSINDVYFNALLLVLSTQVDDIQYYAGVIPQARAAYAKAKASLLQRTGSGATVAGLKPVVAKVTESEDMLLMIDQVVSRRMALVAQARPGEDLAAEESVVANLITLVKSQFDLWAKSVDELVAVTDADSAARQQRAAAAARTAQGVQIVASALALAIGVLAAWWLTRNVTRPIRQAVSVAERVAGGDLAFAIPRGGRDETGALLEALRVMQASLNALVTDVRDAASSIVTASVEVAMGNSELSQRTESAASHLQHTSSSIDQLGQAAQRSADSAQRVDALVREAAHAAAQGGDVATQAVQSIQAIAAQSQRIGDIVGLIEGIAFRTNILALNAAIEAAGAGEQGRGFAVVAGEVRNLAQRSATAAKDIAALIEASMRSVAQGSQWVRDAGDHMAAIVNAVNRVTSATQEISHATRAQSTDLTRIGAAMGEMDRMTQQNAALVEQSAAAAEMLKGQSQRLTRIVAMFRLQGEVPETAVVTDRQP